MKMVAIICNIILFGFTCMVIVTDGLSRETGYIVITLWWLLTMILNSVVISLIGDWQGFRIKSMSVEEQQKKDNPHFTRVIMRMVTIICNFVFIGFSSILSFYKC